MKNLAKAIIAVMKEVKGIEKSQTIGTGSMSYKGVPDQEVKKIIGSAMEKNGLCILPIGVEAKTQVDRWEETSQYGVKMKQSVFTEATCKYLLLHESGESQVLEGYGQGVDSQDKSAGKATTYSLKYTLLYTFLVPTGKIDDADNTHSDDIQTPTAKITAPITPPTPPPADLATAADYTELSTLLADESLAKVVNFHTKPAISIEAFKGGIEKVKAANTLKKAKFNEYKAFLTAEVKHFTANPQK